MQIAVVNEGVPENTSARQPWNFFRDALRTRGIELVVFEGETRDAAFERAFDAMLVYAWLDWNNPKLFDGRRILPLLAKYSAYRAQFPETVQIVVNHTDMSRRPYATPYWRVGDPVLYRTPAYDREVLKPFPAESIWPYEVAWGGSTLASNEAPTHKAGFIGTTSGPKGYRLRVAEFTAKVGIGLCSVERPCLPAEYRRLLADCAIIVCPRGWGEQSMRHWDAWRSNKPVLTDRACDSVEMIPGRRLKAGVHYLVYDEPEEIPGIVEEWTRPSKREALAEIAANGRVAAESYDGLQNLVEFFETMVAKRQ